MLETERDSEVDDRPTDSPVPGFVVVFDGAQPTLRSFRIGVAGTVIGRELLGDTSLDDRLSRQHARVRIERGRFVVTDLGSRNGTFVDGSPVITTTEVAPPAVVRTGRTIAVLLPDVRRFEHTVVEIRDGVVIGPTLAMAWQQVGNAARSGDVLLLTGESGTGKELAAQAFHRSTGARGELIAINCAAIPAGLAERLLFGAQRGAFSGADRDVEGYFAAAQGGTIFLDEIGELEPLVQAKLLRALDAREIIPVGASRPRPIDVRVVAATLRDLAAEVAAGRFRDDLYFRVGRPQVTLPPVRHRVDDLAYLVTAAVQRVSPAVAVHASLIETCLLRRWPGNVRELVGEVRRAAFVAVGNSHGVVRSADLLSGQSRCGEVPLRAEISSVRPAGSADPTSLRRRGISEPIVESLSSDLDRGSAAAKSPMLGGAGGPGVVAPAPLPAHEVIVAALRSGAGNVTRAARALGLHRNQLRRYLARHPEIAITPDTQPMRNDGDSDT